MSKRLDIFTFCAWTITYIKYVYIYTYVFISAFVTDIVIGNLKTWSCNARAVKIYNATSSLVRLENKKIFSFTNSVGEGGLICISVQSLYNEMTYPMHAIARWR
jgi:hypothetical protein